MRVTRVEFASVVLSKSNNDASGRQGWKSAYEGRCRRGDRFAFDRLNLWSCHLLVG